MARQLLEEHLGFQKKYLFQCQFLHHHYQIICRKDKFGSLRQDSLNQRPRKGAAKGMSDGDMEGPADEGLPVSNEPS